MSALTGKTYTIAKKIVKPPKISFVMVDPLSSILKNEFKKLFNLKVPPYNFVNKSHKKSQRNKSKASHNKNGNTKKSSS
jgi:excinuclease UvrABC helicase subunit UvrB